MCKKENIGVEKNTKFDDDMTISLKRFNHSRMDSANYTSIPDVKFKKNKCERVFITVSLRNDSYVKISIPETLTKEEAKSIYKIIKKFVKK